MATPTPPSGWRMTAGIWNIDADLSPVSGSVFFGGSRIITLKNTLVATEIETDPIPVRRQAQSGTNFEYEVSSGYQADSTAAGNTLQFGIRYYAEDGTLLSTTYMLDDNTTLLDGSGTALATDTNYAECSALVAPSLVGTNVSFVTMFFQKAATAFNVKIFGATVRQSTGHERSTATSASVSVADTNASWATVPRDASDDVIRMSGNRPGGTSASQSPLVTGYYMSHAVAKCESVPVGAEFAIRLVYNGPLGVRAFEGQRIVSCDATRTYQIVAWGFGVLIAGDYVTAEVQYYSGSGTEPNITVELVDFTLSDNLSWK